MLTLGQIMQQVPTLFLSNRTEFLYEKLKEELFGSEAQIFARRLVIVPSAAMKMWLQLTLAQDPDYKIAAGIEVAQIDPALMRLSAMISTEDAIMQPSLQPQQGELALLFEELLLRIIAAEAEMPTTEKLLWQPLFAYLKVLPHRQPQRLRRRLLALCNELASLFMQYGCYGCQMLSEWSLGGGEGWQPELWRRLLAAHPALLFPYQLLERLTAHIQAGNSCLSTDLRVYLFGVSFIPNRVHHFLTALATACPVHYYFLSPCQMFWGDNCSDREKARLQNYWAKRGASEAQQKALEEFLSDSNALLGNFGRMGREMTRQMEDTEIDAEALYVIAQGVAAEPLYQEMIVDGSTWLVAEPFTLLKAVQADMALLRSTEGNLPKIDLEAFDDSIQLHVAMTRQREVEILYNNLAKVLTRHSEDSQPLTPSDIIVMVPNYTDYAPFISAVFGAGDSAIKFQMMEFDDDLQSPLIRAYFNLLDIAKGRWVASDLLELLKEPAFCRRQQFSSADCRLIQNWIVATGVRWGHNAQHRQELLDRDHPSQYSPYTHAGGTWENSRRRLILGLICEDADGDHLEVAVSPLSGVESSQAELIEKWLALMQALRFDLAPLADASEKSVADWSAYLIGLFENYFQVDPAISRDSKQREILLEELQAIGRSKRFLQECRFPFESIHLRLLQNFEKRTQGFHEQKLQAVRFCPLLPTRAVPARVIALLGLEEGAFPRRQNFSELNVLAGCQEVDYAPSVTDLDRYLFLEALLSVRQLLLLSYVGYCFEAKKERAPALVVQELFNAIDQGYTIAGKAPSEHCKHQHPFDAFAPAYFTAESPFPSYRLKDYRCAVAACRRPKLPASCLISDFAPTFLPSGQATDTLHLDLCQLMDFAANPLKTYLKKKLGLYISETASHSDDELFSLDALDKHKFQREAIKSGFTQTLCNSEKRDALPVGMFKQFALEQLQTSLDQVKDRLLELGGGQTQLRTLLFSNPFEHADLLANGVEVLRPIELSLADGRLVIITGSLQDVFQGGILNLGKLKPKALVKNWPALLVLAIAIERDRLSIAPQIVFLDRTHQLILGEENPQALLTAFIDYYLLGNENPSPLLPEWIEALIAQDAQELENQMHTMLFDRHTPCYDNYAKWLFPEPYTLPSPNDLISAWWPLAKGAYGSLFKKRPC